VLKKSTRVQKKVIKVAEAQSFSPFSSQDGAQIQLGQQTCHPSCAKKGLKDWAIDSNRAILCTNTKKIHFYLQ
jgi:hypothetical protein